MVSLLHWHTTATWFRRRASTLGSVPWGTGHRARDAAREQCTADAESRNTARSVLDTGLQRIIVLRRNDGESLLHSSPDGLHVRLIVRAELPHWRRRLARTRRTRRRRSSGRPPLARPRPGAGFSRRPRRLHREALAGARKRDGAGGSPHGAVDDRGAAERRRGPRTEHDCRTRAVFLERFGAERDRRERPVRHARDAADRIAGEPCRYGRVVGQARVAVGGEPFAHRERRHFPFSGWRAG